MVTKTSAKPNPTNLEAQFLQEQKITPLHIAVREKHSKCVENILKPVKQNQQIVKNILTSKDDRDCIPLYVAIEKKNAEIVDILLRYEKDLGYPNLTSPSGRHHVLNLCGKYGTDQIFQSLLKALEASSNLLSVKDKLKGTLPEEDMIMKMYNQVFFASVQENNEELTRYLIGEGANMKADINEREESHHALKVAVEKGYSGIVEDLLEKDDLDWKTIFFKDKKKQDNLLHLTRNFKVLDKLITHVKTKIKSKEVEVSRMLEGKDKDGNTPIHLVCKYSRWSKEEFQKFLDFHKESKIDLASLQNNERQTPLHIATVEGNIEYVKAMRNKREPTKFSNRDSNSEEFLGKEEKKKKEK